MPQEVELPDGTIVEFPDGMTAQEIESVLATQFPPPPRERTFSDAVQRQGGLTARALTEGAGATAGLVSNPLNATINEVFGTNLSTDLRKTISDTLTEAGIAKPDTPTERLVQSISQALASSAAPVGATLQLAKRAAPARTALLESIKRNPGAFLGAEATAAIGSGAGEQVAREIAPESGTAPIIGALAGGLGPSALDDAARNLVRAGSADEIAEGIADAERLGLLDGLSPSFGTLSRNNKIIALENTIAKIPGGKRILAAAKSTEERLGKAVERFTGNGETSSSRAGRVIQDGLFGEKGFVTRFRSRSEKFFNEVDRFIPPTTDVSVSNTRAALQAITGRISGAPRTSEALSNSFMRQINEAFLEDAGNTISVPYDALKQLRSAVGRKLSSNVIVGDVDRADLKRLYSALTEDMADAAAQAGPEASKALQRANRFYRAGIKRIDDQLNQINRKVNSEDVFRTVISGSAEGASRLNAIKRSLQPGEWRVVVNTITRRLGRATGSNQNELGEVFSAETFLTNWNKLAPEAKAALYSQFPGYRKNIDAIARTAARLRQARRTAANPSGTAAAVTNIGLGAAGGGAFLTNNAGLGAGLVLGLIATNRAAQLLTSPKFARWAATTINATPQRLPAQISRLATMAEGDDEIADEIASALSGVFGEIPVLNSEADQN